MREQELVTRVIEEQLAGSDLFLVEIKQSPTQEIEVVIDSDSRVSIDRCVALSKAIEAVLDREEADFQLTVTSAGIGQPLQLLRQYRKLIGRQVELVFKEGSKLIATLTDATPEAIRVEYTERVAVEGKKRKVEQVVDREIPLSELKLTREHLTL